MGKYTNEQIANDYRLWGEYFDTGAEMTEAEFDAMPVIDRISLLVEAFGKSEN